MVAFHRAYKRLRVEKDDELRVTDIDHGAGIVKPEGKDEAVVVWYPYKLSGRTGGSGSIAPTPSDSANPSLPPRAGIGGGFVPISRISA